MVDHSEPRMPFTSAAGIIANRDAGETDYPRCRTRQIEPSFRGTGPGTDDDDWWTTYLTEFISSRAVRGRAGSG